MTTRTPARAPRRSQVRAISPAAELDAYLRTIAGQTPRPRLLEIRFVLRRREMGRVFLAAHNAAGAARFIRRMGTGTDVYVGASLRSRAAGGRDAVDHSHLAFVEIDASDAHDRLAGFAHAPP